MNLNLIGKAVLLSSLLVGLGGLPLAGQDKPASEADASTYAVTAPPEGLKLDPF